MKNFILLFTGFLILTVASIYFVFSMADGRSDAYYKRFVTGRQSSMIIGTSRSAQGILPSVLNKKLSGFDFFNFSFSINISPFGPTYFESIKQKVADNTKNGIFILAMDPWCISDSGEYVTGQSKFSEDDEILNKISPNGSNPNVSYLLNCYDNHYWEIIVPNTRTFLHDDGWLEVTVPMDRLSIKKRQEKKIKEYINRLPSYSKFSATRYRYLTETINYLKQKGQVFLVRIPVDPAVMEIENNLMPDFNNRVQNLIDKTGVSYLDLSGLNDKLQYTDGSHLFKESARQVTDSIANWILAHKN